MKKIIFLLLLSTVLQISFAGEFDIVVKPMQTEVEKPTITADKVNGTISVYFPATKQTVVQPALFGKVKSNKLDLASYDIPGKQNGITPAGSFPITKMVSWRLNEHMLAFIEGQATIIAIHPIWNGNKDQHRIQRLKSSTADDNRITQGCINVDSDFFYTVLNTVPDGTILTILPE
jgi:hypothetical protein